MSKKIHIVMIVIGEYSDRNEYVYKAFSDKDKAAEVVSELSEKIKSIDSNQPYEKKREMFENILGIYCFHRHSGFPNLYIVEGVDLEDGDEQ